ncbi:uncharacterized protein LOC106135750 isoform X1 [Amyelois transitella]|uniref:uncharacterized protein LOC106135750 isoform X1 n=1 Tax=Amyelois transitella TaxID=680683 RepID=UPI00067D43CB|nr:uncharacterized protein LOC106135750 isoform X1 [Amyelois transitella]
MEGLDIDRVTFKVNGNSYSVGSEVSSTLTLVDYIRNVLELRGTKYMCREGGCGACIVTAVKSPGTQPIAVNSCLVSVTSCQGWEITTVEKVGNKLEGYHEVQKRLAAHNGTQCGYCTPGWVMSMYSLLNSKKELTMLEIEKSFGSNLCRCTGYRPILEAFKTFAKDAPDKIADIEDLSICSKTGKKCNKDSDKDSCDEDEWCLLSKDEVDIFNNIFIKLKDGRYWFTVPTVRDIFRVLRITGDDSYMLVSGNTAKGAYPIDEYPRVLIDISNVIELKGYAIDQNLIIGAGNTLTELLNIFEIKSQDEYFSYLKQFYDHLQLVAHIPVRNLGSMAGNLMIKHQHNEFPSDVFLLLQTVGAQLTLLNRWGALQIVSMENFLKSDMRSRIILNALLPPLNNTTCHVVTFKVMPKSQNAHAIVNAGFFYKFRSNGQVLQTRIAYGGLSPSFVRAYQTERYLLGRSLFTNETLQAALKVLNQDLVVTEIPPEPSVEYRKQCALGLFYKGLLTIYPGNSLAAPFKSGAIKLHETRPVSDARQIFDTNPALWPLNQPMPKIEALIQCSGEAEYTEDLPSFPREVFAAFVLATVSNGKIDNIDSKEALSKPGVLAFYTVKDIPGLNSFTPAEALLYSNNEEILCDGTVKYYNQPIGIIVAESRDLADRAAKLVKVNYSGTKKPVINLKEAKNDQKRLKSFKSEIATDKGSDVKKVVSGANHILYQYHMCMETLVCVTRPTEQGLEVHSAAQWLDGTQLMISRALKMDENRIDVYVRRLGGAYGLKISRSIQSTIACCLVVTKLNRPCRFIQSLTTNMKAVGKRYDCLNEYEAGVNSSGEIQYINYKTYEGNGYTYNETLSMLGADLYHNCYNKNRWNFNGFDVITDIAKNTYIRSPGTLEAIAMAELLMEHISYALSLDPVDVRLANLDTEHKDIKEMFDTLKANSNYDDRKLKVQKFNKENRWKKRGLRTTFSKWNPIGGLFLDVNMSVYHGDGTVAITHGGVDMGQGVNTLAVQICAYLLKIDVDKIQVKGNNTIIAPNCFISGGSLTSSNVSIGVQRCCEQLLKRLEPIRATLNNPTWEELIEAAYIAEVDLQAHGFVRVTDAQVYNIYGVAFAEVEVDVLTGESEIRRVDILQDVGRSVNPEIDIGQVEGAFIMGQGYWTSENIKYDAAGNIQTDRTWNYYVPQARDIPQDFRVFLRKKSFSNEILLGSKATGEPPMCLSVVVALAIKEAIAAARRDSGIPTTEWFPIEGPFTTDKICMLAKTKIEDFKFY